VHVWVVGDNQSLYLFPSTHVSRKVKQGKSTVTKSFPPCLSPQQFGLSERHLPKLALKFLTQPAMRLEDTAKQVMTEAKRQRYFPSFIVIATGAGDAADSFLPIPTIQGRFLAALELLRFSFKEVIPNQLYPYDLKKIAVLSIPEPMNDKIFETAQTEPPFNRRVALNKAISLACDKAEVLHVDLDKAVSPHLKDPFSQYRHQAEAYHVSPQVGALVTHSVFSLIFEIILEAQSEQQH
jgi:hypothetical protein